MELYNYLPKANCGKCGYPICSTFPVSVFQGDSKLSQCEIVKEPKFVVNLEKMVKKFGRMFVISLGYNL